MTILRPVSPTDYQQWTVLFQAYAEFYGTTIEAETEKTVWNWIVDPDNDFWCDVAIDETGSIIGFVQYQLMHRSLSGAMVCYLSDLYVKPNERGNGIGKQLIDNVFVFAKDRGISNVRWLTQEFNYAGRKLYDSYAKKSDFILYSVPIA